jgi:primosomal protein N' (replication factor Y)
MYCQVIISKSSRNIDKKFTYKIPDNLINKVKIGMRVLVDFNNQKSEAMVVCIIDETDISDAKIKYIIDIIDKLPIITENIITLVEWMREYL